MDDLAKLGEAKLRHHAAALGKVGKPLDVRHHFAQQAFADLGNLLLGIPAADRLEVRDGGGRETDAVPARHVSRARAAA